MNRLFSEYLLIFFKGMAMGAADVVPGVSGGTIAFITGIYDRLLAAISACTPNKLVWLLRGRIRETWQSIDGNFLVALLAGVVTSIATLANLISYLLGEHPELVWSFFFGLILVSVVLVGREIQRWNLWTLAMLLVGAAFAYVITVAAPLQWPVNPVMIFLAGAIAICAMILPGISGSFILLLLGLYATVLGAVRSFDVTLLTVFIFGCLVGILSFSRLLSWLLQHARDVTLAFLTGLMLGSLNKVWPWKQTLTWRENSQGVMEPLQQVNLLPSNYELLTGAASYWTGGVMLMLAAIVLVLGLEWFGQRLRQD
ncbi:putative membrane protein [Halopseudomonas litoralis]|uniref:Putative membrane protein n=2 Tax=Halopseudomonas litoralis TaxID=797277 RepID=A0A1H1N6Q1_9GAMM|nr:putative membrane protein [Halopseudomonas litoralis]